MIFYILAILGMLRFKYYIMTKLMEFNGFDVDNVFDPNPEPVIFMDDSQPWIKGKIKCFDKIQNEFFKNLYE